MPPERSCRGARTLSACSARGRRGNPLLDHEPPWPRCQRKRVPGVTLGRKPVGCSEQQLPAVDAGAKVPSRAASPSILPATPACHRDGGGGRAVHFGCRWPLVDWPNRYSPDCSSGGASLLQRTRAGFKIVDGASGAGNTACLSHEYSLSRANVSVHDNLLWLGVPSVCHTTVL